MEMDESTASTLSIDFCSFGMFIIDEIDFGPGKAPAKDVIGGAGAYAALGARLFSPPPLSKSVGWIVDCGSDFPETIRSDINQWQTSCVMRDTPNRLTTRALNTYHGDEFRAFHYLTPKLRLDVDSLTAELLRSKSFHAVCSPTRIIDIATKLTQRRLDDCNGQNLNRPMIIWEPVPDVCVPNELENCFEAVKLVDVISPNHVELAAFFRERVIEDQLDPSSDEADGVSIEIDPPTVEKYAKVFLASGIGLNGSGLIVVRCGKDGAFAATREKTQWFPAYHSESTTKVVDPTGGGNAFLGGLAVGLARDKSMEESCIWGSIAASFAIEQIGMPKLTKPQNEEQWNGAIVWERVDEFLCKMR